MSWLTREHDAARPRHASKYPKRENDDYRDPCKAPFPCTGSIMHQRLSWIADSTILLLALQHCQKCRCHHRHGSRQNRGAREPRRAHGAPGALLRDASVGAWGSRLDVIICPSIVHVIIHFCNIVPLLVSIKAVKVLLLFGWT
jgi:hypothetical protein